MTREAVYVAFTSDDPQPRDIRAPLVDRDKVLGDQDYVAILIDTLNDRRSGVAFRVNPRGVQTDSVVNDANGEEDFSPDFFYRGGGAPHGARLDRGDAHPARVAALPGRRSAEVGRDPDAQLPARLPLHHGQHAHPEELGLLPLPRLGSGGLRRPADRQALHDRAVFDGQCQRSIHRRRQPRVAEGESLVRQRPRARPQVERRARA